MEENGITSYHFAAKISSTDTSMLKQKPEENFHAKSFATEDSFIANIILFPESPQTTQHSTNRTD